MQEEGLKNEIQEEGDAGGREFRNEGMQEKGDP